MSAYSVLPPGLGALGAMHYSPRRNIIIGTVGIVIMLLCGWAVVSLGRGAARAGGGVEYIALMLPAGVGVVIGGALLALAIGNSREATRVRRLLQGQMLPGEAIEFGADAMLPHEPPATGPDVLANWRVARLRRAALLVTNQRLLVLPGRGLATPVFAWPRDRIRDVSGRIDGNRAVLSADIPDEGRLELWLRGHYDLASAQAALSSSDVPADARRA